MTTLEFWKMHVGECATDGQSTITIFRSEEYDTQGQLMVAVYNQNEELVKECSVGMLPEFYDISLFEVTEID